MFGIFFEGFSFSLSVADLMELFLHDIVLVGLIMQDLELVLDDLLLDCGFLWFFV